MNENQPTPEDIENLLAQVQLRQPKLDVESILCLAAEPDQKVSRPARRFLIRKDRNRRLRYWATLTGVWVMGVTAGILFTYVQLGHSLQTARADLESLKQTQSQHTKLIDAQSQPQEQPAPSAPNRSTPSPQQEDEHPESYRFLAHLNRPGPIDYTLLFNSTRHMPPCKPCVYRVPHGDPTDVPDDNDDAERSPEIKPYNPQPPKTQQQLFQEILKDLNV